MPNPDLPQPNLIVIRSPAPDRAMAFYTTLGMRFAKHQHGKGAEHYAAEWESFVFEIYPCQNTEDCTTNVRLGFTVTAVVDMCDKLRTIGATIISAPQDSVWGKRCVVQDFDGNKVELIENV